MRGLTAIVFVILVICVTLALASTAKNKATCETQHKAWVSGECIPDTMP